jgi:hypothetical protein
VKLLVEESAPEAKPQAGDDGAPRRLFAFPSYPHDRVLDPPAGRFVEDRGVTEPCLADGSGSDQRLEPGIDRVAQRYLDVVKRLEHRRRDPRVPNVQRDGPIVVAAGLG